MSRFVSVKKPLAVAYASLTMAAVGFLGGWFAHTHSQPKFTHGAIDGYAEVCDGGNAVPVKVQGTKALVTLVPEYAGTYLYVYHNVQIANDPGVADYATWSMTKPHSCMALDNINAGDIAGTVLVAATWAKPAFLYWGR